MIKKVVTTVSGVTRSLGQGGGASLVKGAQPLLKYEIIGRNFNDAEKSEQCSKVTRKLNESNKLGEGRRKPTRGLGGGAPNAVAIFPPFYKK